jgi:tetratricopeptide (TPR) repeat protein
VEGIIRYVGNDEIWKDFLSSKLQQQVFNEDTSALVQFSRFITSDEYYKGGYNDFLALLSVPTASLINWAVLNKAVNTFPDSLQFKVMLAEFYLNGKNYPLANNYFQQALQLPMQPAVRADIRFIYGFSLYKNKDFKQAIPLFQDQFNDENVFKQQASKYFVGKMTNDKVLLKQLVNSEQKSKYVPLADVLLSTIK